MDRVSADPDIAFGTEIVARARAWIGTPYLHQASRRGAGADCLGLLRGLWRELHGHEPEVVPPYTPDWSEPERAERLLEAARRHLLPIQAGEVRDGDVLIFRMVQGGMAKHLGVRATAPAGYPTVIHAYSGRGVVESPLGGFLRRRVAATFRIPSRPA